MGNLRNTARRIKQSPPLAHSPEHELTKEVLGRFVETLAEELAVQIYPLGSTTFKRPEISGAEPDKCFYIYNIDAVRGKK